MRPLDWVRRSGLVAPLPFWIAVPTICYDYWDAPRDAKNELFDECDDANVDFLEAVKNLR